MNPRPLFRRPSTWVAIGVFVLVVLAVAVVGTVLALRGSDDDGPTPEPSAAPTTETATPSQSPTPESTSEPETPDPEGDDDRIVEALREWAVTELEPIPTTTDHVEYAEAFASVWMGPSPGQYSRDTFEAWIEGEFVPNEDDPRLTLEAELAIEDQELSAAGWDVMAEQEVVQGVEILSAEKPTWFYDFPTGPREVQGARERGWPGVEFIEVWATVYIGGVEDDEPYFYAETARDTFGVVCNPECGVGEVLTEELRDWPGAQEYVNPAVEGH